MRIDGMEKRRFERFSQNLQVKYCSLDDTAQLQKGTLGDDIGIGGVRLGLNEEFPVGHRVRFSVRQSANSGWSPEIDGIVVWQRSAGSHLHGKKATGVCFSPDQTLINDYLTHFVVKAIDDESGNRTLEERLPHVGEMQVEPAYDGSKTTYKLVRFFGWGPLNNLGYFRFASPFSFVNLVTSFVSGKVLYLLPEAQRRLIVRSVKLLGVKKGDKILDVACGKGMSSFIAASTYPESIVTGIDLIANNVGAAKALYGGAPNLRFLIDNAMDLKFGDHTINKIMCVEAAFHFPDRRKFIMEAHRILKPSGRLVIVDFMWKNDKTRLPSDDPRTQLVQSEWQWSDFFSITDYLRAAEYAGFHVDAQYDWSAWVIDPLGYIFKTVAFLGNTYFGRVVLNRLNPLLKAFSDDDWKRFMRSAEAHDHVRRNIKYVALVLTK